MVKPGKVTEGLEKETEQYKSGAKNCFTDVSTPTRIPSI